MFFIWRKNITKTIANSRISLSFISASFETNNISNVYNWIRVFYSEKTDMENQIKKKKGYYILFKTKLIFLYNDHTKYWKNHHSIPFVCYNKNGLVYIFNIP